MSRIRLVSMLLLPLVCVVVRSAKQFRLQCNVLYSLILGQCSPRTIVLALILTFLDLGTLSLLSAYPCTFKIKSSQLCYPYFLTYS